MYTLFIFRIGIPKVSTSRYLLERTFVDTHFNLLHLKHCRRLPYHLHRHFQTVYKSGTLTVHINERTIMKIVDININRQKDLAAFLKKNYKPDQLTITKDVDVYALYVKQTKNPMTKNVFTRELKALGLFRTSRRFGSDVYKVYIYKNLKPCPTCTDCQTCNNTRYI